MGMLSDSNYEAWSFGDPDPSNPNFFMWAAAARSCDPELQEPAQEAKAEEQEAEQ